LDILASNLTQFVKTGFDTHAGGAQLVATVWRAVILAAAVRGSGVLAAFPKGFRKIADTPGDLIEKLPTELAI